MTNRWTARIGQRPSIGSNGSETATTPQKKLQQSKHMQLAACLCTPARFTQARKLQTARLVRAHTQRLGPCSLAQCWRRFLRALLRPTWQSRRHAGRSVRSPGRSQANKHCKTKGLLSTRTRHQEQGWPSERFCEGHAHSSVSALFSAPSTPPPVHAFCMEGGGFLHFPRCTLTKPGLLSPALFLLCVQCRVEGGSEVRTTTSRVSLDWTEVERKTLIRLMEVQGESL